MQKFESVLDRVRDRELSQLQAAEILGMSERTFRRWRDRLDDEGLEGLFDRRLGKASARAVPVDEIGWLLEQYRTRYDGWTVKHFHDHLKKHHSFRWGYTWTKSQLHAAGLVKRAPRRGAHRRKRPRRPLVGMMVHQDGSSHAWLAGQAPLDLIVTLDDATSEIYSAFLVEEEGTMSSFTGLLAVIEAKGLPCSLYTDRGGHYFHTPEAGGKVDKTRLTQVGRALAQLGIEHIAAYSPEARGRSEPPSAPYRTASSRNSSSPASPRSRPPTGSLPRSICPTTTAVSPSPRNTPTAPSWRPPWRSAVTSCAARKSVSSPTTTPSATTACRCSCRRAPAGLISSRRACVSTNIQTAPWRCFTVRDAWPTTPPTDASSGHKGWPRDPFRRAPAYGFVDNACGVPHNSTGPTSTTEAVISRATKTGQFNVLSTAHGAGSRFDHRGTESQRGQWRFADPKSNASSSLCVSVPLW